MRSGKCCGVVLSVALLALAYDAAAGPGQTVPAEEPSPEAVAKLLVQLGAAHYSTRQQASAALEKLGRPVLPALRKAAKAKTELEVRQRIERVVIRIEAASVEERVKAYRRAHRLKRDLLEPWQSALAPAGRVFRYKIRAVPAQEKRRELAERYAFLFVDPAAGNVYDLKRTPGGDATVEQRTWAILRLMGTKVADSNHAEAVMGDLCRINHWLNTVRPGNDPLRIDDDPIPVRVVQVTKRESWIEPAMTYHADTENSLRLVMTVDDDGYVTGFRIWNIR
jgi:hypothetical protein